MNEAAKIVSDSIIGSDFRVVVVNEKAYVINPPTIHKIAGAASYLSNIGDMGTLGEVLSSMKDTPNVSHALSWFINGNDELFEELSKGTFDENVEALSVAYSLVSVENFTKLSALAKSVANLTANQK
ncbi:MAG: hypothetical protein RRY36_10115 [Bacteroidaceae bacterium]